MRYLGLSLTKARQLLEGCPGVTWDYVVAVDRDYREMRFEQLMRLRKRRKAGR